MHVFLSKGKKWYKDLILRNFNEFVKKKSMKRSQRERNNFANAVDDKEYFILFRTSKLKALHWS